MSLPPRTPEPTAPNPSTAAARVVLDELARCGVEHVVMAPGSRSTALVVAAEAHPDLRLHVEVDERSAAFLALGIGRASGRPAVVVTTSGTAVANLLPAVVEADHDRVPLLLLTADRPPELHGTGANQTIEQRDIFGASTRLAVDLGVPGTAAEEVARWRWTACRAHGVAVGRPVETPGVIELDAWREPGPVHLNAPFREPTVPATDDGRTRAQPFRHPLDGRRDGAPWAAPLDGQHVPAEHVLEDVLDTLTAAPDGLVVVGGSTGAPVGDVTTLARLLGWPVVAEPHTGVTGDGVVDHGSLLLGSADWAAEHTPGLLLRIGRPTIAREVVQLVGRTPQVVLDAHGGWGAADAEHMTLVRGEVAPTIAALVAGLRARHHRADGAWRAAWTRADATADAAIERHLDEVGAPSEPATARDVLAAVPAGGRLVVGSSMPIRDLDLVARRRDDVTVLANRGTSGIDGFTSTALGTALAVGPTVALCGDLTLLHDSNGWLLAPDPDADPVDLVVVVVDNDGGGIFSFLPQREHVAAYERIVGTPHGRDLRHLATLHDLGYATVTRRGDVAAAVSDALARGGRHLVHVHTDRDENLALHRSLRTAVATALANA